MFCAQGICHPLQQEDSPRRLAYAIAECVIGWVATGAFTEWEKKDWSAINCWNPHKRSPSTQRTACEKNQKVLAQPKIEVNMYYQLKSQQLKMRFVHRIDD